MTKGKLSASIDAYHAKLDDGVSRDYIGASSIGSDCLRQIWYEFKGFKCDDVEPRLRRTWEIGRKLESLVINWALDTGYSLLTLDRLATWRDPEKASQNFLNVLHFVDKDYPFFQGNCDAVFDVEPRAILEIKTAKDSSFNQFVKDGLLKWMPKYYAQVQAYMGMSGINSAYILVLNKDNSDLFDEKVSFDPVFYEKLREKAKMVYDAQSEPPRISGSPVWYQCKMCKFRKVCHT